MKQNQSLERRGSRPSGLSMWSFVGGAALLLAAAAVVVSLPDIKRYIKISRM
ncbi:MAG: hypothetical protein WCD76_03790 [Pyrinomonadaceae bacterium]